MTDTSEYWQDHKDYKNSQRMFWIHCPECDIYKRNRKSFYTKTGKCINCGYEDGGLVEITKCFKCHKIAFNMKLQKCTNCGNEPKWKIKI